MIGFNKPYSSGKEIEYIMDAIAREKISGNGYYTQKCQAFLENRYGIKKALLTSSCTDALEMAALLINTQPGDEIIIPSYTFVSTANAFVLRGANIVFADSHSDNPNIDETKIEELITKKTKAIVVVHYAGFSCDMDTVMSIAKKHNLYVIEDAAQAIESKYKDRPLGSIGHLACFSFHETKNIISGEGGALLINEESFIKRAEIIWEKGTNRAAFYRGEIDKYNWVDVGSSFLMSEITAAFLWAQLESINDIQKKRYQIWDLYYQSLSSLKKNNSLRLPSVPVFCKHNAHIFYLLTQNESERGKLLTYLNLEGINAIFHYLALHKSPYCSKKYDGKQLTYSEKYTSVLIRLPIYFDLDISSVSTISKKIIDFYKR